MKDDKLFKLFVSSVQETIEEIITDPLVRSLFYTKITNKFETKSKDIGNQLKIEIAQLRNKVKGVKTS